MRIEERRSQPSSHRHDRRWIFGDTLQMLSSSGKIQPRRWPSCSCERIRPSTTFPRGVKATQRI